MERIEALQQDPVGDVRSSAAALLKKIERVQKAAKSRGSVADRPQRTIGYRFAIR
jgi:hypothetical protein